MPEVVLVGQQHELALVARRARRRWNSSLIAGGTMSSLPPCVNSTGTPIGSRAAGDAVA